MRHSGVTPRHSIWDELPALTVIVTSVTLVALAVCPPTGRHRALAIDVAATARSVFAAHALDPRSVDEAAIANAGRLAVATPDTGLAGDAAGAVDGDRPEAAGCVGPGVGGRPDGLWVVWHPSGAPGAAGLYRSGRRIGVWRFWFADGAPRSIGRFADGRPDGAWLEWHPNGRPRRSATYRRGRLSGRLIEWWGGGGLRSTGDYGRGARELGPAEAMSELPSEVDGDREGLWREWHENGRLLSEAHYLGGLRHGPWRAWFDDGRVREDGSFELGRRQGRWLFYEHDGALSRLRSGLYRDGLIVRE